MCIRDRNEDIANAYFTLAGITATSGKKAEYYSSALKIYDKLHIENENVALGNYNIGVIHESKDNYKKAIKTYRSLNIENATLASIYHHLGNLSAKNTKKQAPVSYTHLTLPTICSV
eukprot:TRINITY_DN11377_c0_g1_i1.p1 TRINITY_DN11377_c0_g1~~TRINITY_DN11377_c0_g1_i1.p1  ORF type:complete len:117 (+),score=30.53 TRINITY_DN11377_c0_g1_i1:3-353(+)